MKVSKLMSHRISAALHQSSPKSPNSSRKQHYSKQSQFGLLNFLHVIEQGPPTEACIPECIYCATLGTVILFVLWHYTGQRINLLSTQGQLTRIFKVIRKFWILSQFENYPMPEETGVVQSVQWLAMGWTAQKLEFKYQ